MNWNRVRWLFLREVKDQLRDRRTMFTILVLPLLLYPLMGVLMMQVAQLRTLRELHIAVLNSEELPEDFANWPDSHQSVAEQVGAEILTIKDSHGNAAFWSLLASANTDTTKPNLQAEDYRELLHSLKADAILLVHSGDIEKLETSDVASAAGPSFEIIADLASDSAQLAQQHALEVIDGWRTSHIKAELVSRDLEPTLLDPASVQIIDVAAKDSRKVMLWAKVLPLIMFVWALTGAFYPAIDLCAGEKERGTLETLLSGPATRREIVYGKLMAVICFSILTAVLNLLSMQLTISIVSSQFISLGPEYATAMGPLPLGSIGWLLVMLLPISILFSAVALAIAALARSSKEGQYYLMPLLLVGMPMVMLPMLPGIRLSIGTSMFPVAGAILLARSLVEGEYSQALLFCPLVVLVTSISCWLATRWAVRQFETDTVLFRETDRFDMSAWLQHLWRDRASVASPTMAMICGFIILIGLFYGRLQSAGGEITWSRITESTIATQLAMILAPCLIMAIFLTTSIRKALRIDRVSFLDLVVAALLAISLHPTYVAMAQWISIEFPFGEQTKVALQGVDAVFADAPLWSVLLVLAIIPAICEELAFRGFIFAGLAHNRGMVRAVVVTSLLFGLSHGVLQQSISASVMGLVLGMVAWRTGSVVCCIVIHVLHNSLSMSMVRLSSVFDSTPKLLQPFVQSSADGGFAYTSNWQAISVVLAIAAVLYFFRRPAIQAQQKFFGNAKMPIASQQPT